MTLYRNTLAIVYRYDTSARRALVSHRKVLVTPEPCGRRVGQELEEANCKLFISTTMSCTVVLHVVHNVIVHDIVTVLYNVMT